MTVPTQDSRLWPTRLRTILPSAALVGGGAISTGAWLALGLDPAWPLGAAAGAVVAVVAQRAQIAWYATTIRRSEGSAWLERLPLVLASLRRPLGEIRRQVDQHRTLLDEATARQRLQEVDSERMGLQVLALEQALTDARSDVAAILASLDRVLEDPEPARCLRAQVSGLRQLVALEALAGVPSSHVALGDLVASVVEAGGGRRRVVLDSTLPVLSAPPPLVEAVIASILGTRKDSGEVVRIRGDVENSLAVLTVSPPAASSGIDAAVLQRAVRLLGGVVSERQGATVVVLPLTYRMGLPAVRDGGAGPVDPLS